jgi:hypothetical protein
VIHQRKDVLPAGEGARKRSGVDDFDKVGNPRLDTESGRVTLETAVRPPHFENGSTFQRHG